MRYWEKPTAQRLEETTDGLLKKIKAYLLEKGTWVEHDKDCEYYYGRCSCTTKGESS